MTVVTGHVVWIRRSGEVRRMTTITIGVQPGEDVVDMTGIACNTLVSTGQRERRGSMVERCGFPCCSRVTRRTVMAEIARQVIRICGRSKICCVTAVAIR